MLTISDDVLQHLVKNDSIAIGYFGSSIKSQQLIRRYLQLSFHVQVMLEVIQRFNLHGKSIGFLVTNWISHLGEPLYILCVYQRRGCVVVPHENFVWTSQQLRRQWGIHMDDVRVSPAAITAATAAITAAITGSMALNPSLVSSIGLTEDMFRIIVPDAATFSYECRNFAGEHTGPCDLDTAYVVIKALRDSGTIVERFKAKERLMESVERSYPVLESLQLHLKEVMANDAIKIFDANEEVVSFDAFWKVFLQHIQDVARVLKYQNLHPVVIGLGILCLHKNFVLVDWFKSTQGIVQRVRHMSHVLQVTTAFQRKSTLFIERIEVGPTLYVDRCNVCRVEEQFCYIIQHGGRCNNVVFTLSFCLDRVTSTSEMVWNTINIEQDVAMSCSLQECYAFIQHHPQQCIWIDALVDGRIRNIPTQMFHLQCFAYERNKNTLSLEDIIQQTRGQQDYFTCVYSFLGTEPDIFGYYHGKKTKYLLHHKEAWKKFFLYPGRNDCGLLGGALFFKDTGFQTIQLSNQTNNNTFENDVYLSPSVVRSVQKKMSIRDADHIRHMLYYFGNCGRRDNTIRMFDVGYDIGIVRTTWRRRRGPLYYLMFDALCFDPAFEFRVPMDCLRTRKELKKINIFL